MTDTSWQARIVIPAEHTQTPHDPERVFDDTRALHDALGDDARRVSANERGETVVRMRLDAPDMPTALARATARVREAARAAGRPQLAERLDMGGGGHVAPSDQAACVDPRDLRGASEAARALRVSKTNVRRLTDPARAERGLAALEVAAELAGGPIITEDAIIDFSRQWRRAPGPIGRPRVVVGLAAGERVWGETPEDATPVAFTVEAGELIGREVTLHAVEWDGGDAPGGAWEGERQAVYVGNTPYLVDDPEVWRLLGNG